MSSLSSTEKDRLDAELRDALNSETDVAETGQSLEVNKQVANVSQQGSVNDHLREVLGDGRRARAFFKRCSVDLLESIIENAQEIREILLEKQAKENKVNEEKLAKRQKILDMMADWGIDMDTLSTAMSGEGQKKRQIKVQYFCKIFDKQYTWTGLGHMPRPFKCHIALGNTLESCRIPDEEQYVVTGKADTSIPKKHLEESERLLAIFIQKHQH